MADASLDLAKRRFELAATFTGRARRMATCASLVIFLAVLVVIAGNAQEGQPIMPRTKAAVSTPEFQTTLSTFKASLNFQNAVAAADIALVPVSERWDSMLNKTGKAVLGAIYSARPSQSLHVDAGAYLVQAIRDADQRVTWTLIRSDGVPKAGNLRVEVQQDRPGEDVLVPIAKIESSASKRRCCFTVDHVQHCGEC